MIIVYKWSGHAALYLSESRTYISFHSEGDAWIGKHVLVDNFEEDVEKYGAPQQIVPIISGHADHLPSEQRVLASWSEHGVKKNHAYNFITRNRYTIVYQLLRASMPRNDYLTDSFLNRWLRKISWGRRLSEWWHAPVDHPIITPADISPFARELSKMSWKQSGEKPLSFKHSEEAYAKALWRPDVKGSFSRRVKDFLMDNKLWVIFLVTDVLFIAALLSWPGLAAALGMAGFMVLVYKIAVFAQLPEFLFWAGCAVTAYCLTHIQRFVQSAPIQYLIRKASDMFTTFYDAPEEEESLNPEDSSTAPDTVVSISKMMPGVSTKGVVARLDGEIAEVNSIWPQKKLSSTQSLRASGSATFTLLGGASSSSNTDPDQTNPSGKDVSPKPSGPLHPVL